MTPYIKIMRVRHWVKNGLIFFPLIFNISLFNFPLLLNSFFAFLTFSLLASIVYIFNDIQDMEKDRLHEVKKHRPLASGAISIKKAVALMIVLVLVLSFISIFILKSSLLAYFYLFTYAIVNILYSLKLKDIPILDVSILMLGFLLRLLYGSEIIGIQSSDWLYLTVVTMSFYLGLGKRRNELQKRGGNTRKVLQFYSSAFLDKFMYLSLTLTITFYSLWAINSENIIIKSGGRLLWSVPVIIIICMRYSMDVESDSYGDPVDVVFSDKILLFMMALYMILMFIAIYGRFLGV